ncbi:MAG: aminotransferase class I/II-fold pyridoxal phosphate-dependent enzyme [Clostridiales bacterium]|nr:aminotransferase class I/II-fold pyridoxal phosphate-dependent enzyme [Clostridiales bacterium]
MRNSKLNIELQKRAPIKEALENLKNLRVVPFDVPGHKRGKGNAELTQFLGTRCMEMDVNSMKPLDNLAHPVSVIREAEELAALAFGAAHAFFMVNGTTAAVQSMILYACKPGDKIILSRNVHKSVINALVLSGAIPVYLQQPVHEQLHISLSLPLDVLEDAVKTHPDAKAIFVTSPSYYGICSDLRSISDLAHRHGMLLLADEAHGTHLYFGAGLPQPAMAMEADLAAVSMHKSGGSLTQSSLLLAGSRVDAGALRQTINLTQSTSASYLLLASLDISRKNLALNGMEIFAHVQQLANYAREEINKLGGYYAYGRELVNGTTIYDFDVTKLAIATMGAGLSGMEVYDLLRDEYDIQVEFGDISNVLAYISVGDRQRELERLVGALSEINRRYYRPQNLLFVSPLPPLPLCVSPKEAYYAPKTPLPLKQSVGRISGELVMCYPPGIPIIAPGEEITGQALEYIENAISIGCTVIGTHDVNIENLQVLRNCK